MGIFAPFSFLEQKVVGPPGPSPVTDASVLLLDATNASSYPGSGNTWSDLSGNSNDADVSLITSYWNAGGYFDFPGTDYTKIATVTHASSLNIFDGDFTILVVGTVDATGTGFSDNVGPVAKFNWDDNPGWGILVNRLTGGADIGRMNLRLSGNWTNFSPDPVFLTVGDWFVMQIVRSGSTVTYYNAANQAIGTGTNAGNGNNSSNFQIGRGKNNATANYKYDGKIAGVALYDKALSEAERQQNIDYFASQLSFPAYDSDAWNFLSTAGITDSTEKSAVNQLVLDLKSAGIWSKLIAIYPFVGGTSTTTKYNLKDTSTFTITWNTGFSFSSDGVTNNGTNSSSTGINISTNLSQNNSSISIYVGSNTAGEDKIDFGAVSGGNGIQLVSRNVANQFGGKMYTNVNDNYSNSDARGFYQFSRDNSSSYYAQKNTTRNTTTRTSNTPPSVVLAIGGLPNLAYATKQYRFASAGQALSTTEMDDFYTAVQAFQTTLGRNV